MDRALRCVFHRGHDQKVFPASDVSNPWSLLQCGPRDFSLGTIIAATLLYHTSIHVFPSCDQALDPFCLICQLLRLVCDYGPGQQSEQFTNLLS